MEGGKGGIETVIPILIRNSASTSGIIRICLTVLGVKAHPIVH